MKLSSAFLTDELLQVSSLLLKDYPSGGRPSGGTAASSEDIPSKEFLERVHSFAKQKLGNLIQARASESQDLGGGQSELIAAKELLNRFGESH